MRGAQGKLVTGSAQPFPDGVQVSGKKRGIQSLEAAGKWVMLKIPSNRFLKWQ